MLWLTEYERMRVSEVVAALGRRQGAAHLGISKGALESLVRGRGVYPHVLSQMRKRLEADLPDLAAVAAESRARLCAASQARWARPEERARAREAARLANERKRTARRARLDLIRSIAAQSRNGATQGNGIRPR